MLHHIILCLDEIEAEISACASELDTMVHSELNAHVADMRGILAGMRQPSAAERKQSDNLLLIRGIDAEVAAFLASNGIDRFAGIADWRADDIAAFSGGTIETGRISREGWIEQAAILASGARTAYARRVEQGDMACLVAAPAELITGIDAGQTARLEGVETSTSELADTTAVAPTETEILAIEPAPARSPTPPPLPSFLPPVFESTHFALLSNIVVAPAAPPAETDTACSSTDGEAETESKTDDALSIAAVTSPLATPPAAAPRKEPAAGKWGRRLSLAASLVLLASVGVMGVQAKMVNAPKFLQLTSAD
jgi:predicted flap endonuclease-1-like 5' DNA nuclease